MGIESASLQEICNTMATHAIANNEMQVLGGTRGLELGTLWTMVHVALACFDLRSKKPE